MKYKVIKPISIILAITFLCQDVVWAHPSAFYSLRPQAYVEKTNSSITKETKPIKLKMANEPSWFSAVLDWLKAKFGIGRGKYERIAEGSVAHGYKFIRLIERGAYGDIWLAKKKGRYFAIKVVSPDMGYYVNKKAVLTREFDTINEIHRLLEDASDVIKVYRLIEVGGSLCMVMEYVEGIFGPSVPAGLKALFEREKRWRHSILTIYEKASVLYQVANLLSKLHKIGIIYGDMKPENILVFEEPASKKIKIKLIDFAHSQKKGENLKFLGTIDCAAPEVLREENTTPAADIYSFGLAMYELFTGDVLIDTAGITLARDKVAKVLELQKTLNPKRPSEKNPKIAEFFCNDRETIELFDNLILTCISPKLEDRPTDDDILRGLRYLMVPDENDLLRGHGKDGVSLMETPPKRRPDKSITSCI